VSPLLTKETPDFNKNRDRLFSPRARIGLFDSGLGGLSVLRRLLATPEAPTSDRRFVYVGDQARCPYGNRSKNEIEIFVEQIVSYLAEQEVDAIIMACNTSAALAGAVAKELSSTPVIDLISLTASFAVQNGLSRVGVLATNATARAKAFSQAIAERNSSIECIEFGCPDLVPLVESGQAGSEAADLAVFQYVHKMIQSEVDAIIMGCTHFPFLESSFEKALAKLAKRPITLIDPARLLVADRGELQSSYDYSRCSFITTGDALTFAQGASVCLGLDDDSQSRLGTVVSISLEDLERALTRRQEFISAQSRPVHPVQSQTSTFPALS